MLRAARITYDVVQRRAHELASREGFGDTVLLELLELVNAWVDRGMVAAVDGHREAELQIIRQTQHERANLVRRVLTGRIPASEWDALVAGLGLGPGRAYHA